MNKLIASAASCSLIGLSACGGGGGEEIAGTYEPVFAPGTPRYEIALSDESLQFEPGYKVVITNGYGVKTWDYSVRGKKITMKHADGSSRKDYSVGSGNCLVYSEGDPTLELQYC